MKLFSLLLFALFTTICLASAQVNVALLHQLVEESKSEYNLQKKAKTNQGKNAINEEVNKNLVNTVKEKYRTIQERFAKLSILIDAIGIGSTAEPLVNSIIDNQQQIVYYCRQDPELILFAIETEKLFVDKSYSLLNYLLGLSASIGVINQMKDSERRILVQHILDELRDINGLSYTTSKTLQHHIERKLGVNPYLGYVATEKALVEEIIQNAKTLMR
ncbi:hypothetical protein SYJ56_04630 [Algoriphagus sp. D3-2-R+10]|uniref:hypothetical protein n=1 Tax=Algoriphagus aurantiacus TaxID=3103948 RepID=UPI002B3C353B|nr:hypothetical protein [Algoriphagus sp. D3-2-R+10]MEB2774578.1 hypothetical protein [Algoriphagus sp. D3-2-R+10]